MLLRCKKQQQKKHERVPQNDIKITLASWLI